MGKTVGHGGSGQGAMPRRTVGRANQSAPSAISYLLRSSRTTTTAEETSQHHGEGKESEVGRLCVKGENKSGSTYRCVTQTLSRLSCTDSSLFSSPLPSPSPINPF